MAVIVTRITNPTGGTAKGSPLTSVEIDANFNNINDAKAEYPTQTGNTGKFLQTDGSTASWATVQALPSQTSHTGQYLTSDGTNASWALLGNAATVTTNANLTGGVTSVGNAATVVTNANLTGDVTSVGNATTLTNAPVIAKVLTGYTSGAGTITASDSILQAIQKLNGNDATNANLTGDVTSTGNATTVVKINGTTLSGLATGILKNTTSTGVPSIAVAGDFPTLNQNTSGSAGSLSSTLAVASGGTGASSASAARTNLDVSQAVVPSTSGNVLTSNGSAWLSSVPAVTLAGSETLTNKTLGNPTVTSYVESVVTIGTVTSTSTISLTSGTVQTATLTSATPCTFTMPPATAGKSFVVLLKQPAAGSATTATFTSVKWGTSGAPTITAVLGKMDILTFAADGVNWYGSAAQGYTP